MHDPQAALLAPYNLPVSSFCSAHLSLSGYLHRTQRKVSIFTLFLKNSLNGFLYFFFMREVHGEVMDSLKKPVLSFHLVGLGN